MNLTQDIRAQIQAHAMEALPREACGLLIDAGRGLYYKRCRNVVEGNRHFIMHHEDWMHAEDEGEVVALVHSHPYMPPNPSPADIASCNQLQIPWFIIGAPTLAEAWLYPKASEILPYDERPYAYGVLDCFSLVRDYYEKELGFTVDFDPRAADEWEWWKKGKDLFRKQVWLDAGFVEVVKPELHDIIVMKIMADVPNHLGVYVGNDVMLHHLLYRLSERTVYGGWWAKHTEFIVRLKR